MPVYDYDEYVSKHSDKFARILLDEETISSINDLAKIISQEKLQEKHHAFDCHNELKRFTTGMLGEAAVEKLLGLRIREWKIGGDSRDYHHPDIKRYNVGIKTVEYGKFPIIFIHNTYPQIICIKSKVYDNLIFVCGLATKEILNTYQDTELILDRNLKKRGTKTGFYGFEYLKPIYTLDDLLA